ncbi:hypothetical protein OAQ34_02030 [Opitutales bacterium]|nr:hypothetical protein [Opitutales bacterium]
MFSIKNTLLLVLLTSLSSLYAQPSQWDLTASYSTGALVIVGTSTYIATQSVPANNTPPDTTYWKSLEETAASLTMTTDALAALPTTAVADLLATLPGAAPDANSTTGGGSSSIRLYGISTSATVTPTDMMVAGIDVKGGTKKVVFQVQANGTYPNAGYVTNPILYVTNSAGTVIATVDDWASGPTSFDSTYYQASFLSELTSSIFAMKGSKEAAIVMNLPEGTYTALVGSNGQTAKAVVAAFEFDSTSSGNLYGISTSGMVTPTDMMVAGIDIKGGTKKVVFQVQANGTYPNAGYVTNPILYITNSAGTVIATVDDWASGPTSFDSTYYQASFLSELTNSIFAMKGSKEAAIVMNLPEGTYTALVGSNGETAKAVVAAFSFD